MSDKIIGVFGARVFEENNMRFLRALQKKSRSRGDKVVVYALETSQEKDVQAVKAEMELCELAEYVPFQALIIMGETIKNQKLIHKIAQIAKKKKIPCFCMDRQVEGCYILNHDEESGFEPMVRHVIEKHGAKQINMLAGFRNNPHSDMRIAQFKKVLAQYEIPFEEERLGYGEFWDRPAQREMKRFLESDLPLPDAIICANDIMAIIACRELRKAGYRVPEDVIVTGFDGIEEGKYYDPIVSTCRPDNAGAVEFIYEEIQKFQESKTIQPKEFVIEYLISPNQSCGCPICEPLDRNTVISNLNADIGDCGWHSLAMNELVTSALPLQTVREIAKILPNTEYMWCDHLRYACVKEELVDGMESKGKFHTLTTIMWGNQEMFHTPGETFLVNQWYEQLKVKKDEYEVVLVRVLHTGGVAYGYTAEAFKEYRQRDVHRFNEFGMFLSNSINMVLQNRRLDILRQNLLQANHELAMLSEKDSMTGIYNRRGFYIRFDEMLQKNQKKYLVLISIDMNRLKYVNDTFGHAEGDFAICALANAVKSMFEEKGICARFGGDEFDCAVFTDDVSRYTLEILQKELQDAIDGIDGILEKPYPVTASVGMVSEEIGQNTSIEDMIRKADALMYENKKNRRRI